MSVRTNIWVGRKTYVIKVDSYEGKVIAGRIGAYGHATEIIFENFVQFVLAMNILLDEAGCPQAEQELRSYPAKRRGKDVPVRFYGGTNPDGKVANLSMSVMFRRNSDWQGYIKLCDADDAVPFRSILELINLLDGALACDDDAQSENEINAG